MDWRLECDALSRNRGQRRLPTNLEVVEGELGVSDPVTVRFWGCPGLPKLCRGCAFVFGRSYRLVVWEKRGMVGGYSLRWSGRNGKGIDRRLFLRKR